MWRLRNVATDLDRRSRKALATGRLSAPVVSSSKASLCFSKGHSRAIATPLPSYIAGPLTLVFDRYLLATLPSQRRQTLPSPPGPAVELLGPRRVLAPLLLSSTRLSLFNYFKSLLPLYLHVHTRSLSTRMTTAAMLVERMLAPHPPQPIVPGRYVAQMTGKDTRTRTPESPSSVSTYSCFFSACMLMKTTVRLLWPTDTPFEPATKCIIREERLSRRYRFSRETGKLIAELDSHELYSLPPV